MIRHKMLGLVQICGVMNGEIILLDHRSKSYFDPKAKRGEEGKQIDESIWFSQSQTGLVFRLLEEEIDEFEKLPMNSSSITMLTLQFLCDPEYPQKRFVSQCRLWDENLDPNYGKVVKFLSDVRIVRGFSGGFEIKAPSGPLSLTSFLGKLEHAFTLNCTRT